MILRTRGLSKVFEVGFRRRKVHAVQDLDLSVERGEIFGFVGPNGAGKTTTIKMLMGLIYPTRGEAFVFDTPIPSREARRRIGYLPENPSFPDFLSGMETLRFLARLSGVPTREVGPRCEELLDKVGLSHAAGRQVRKYSKGMTQRLGIAQALLADPAFVILDEPMSGLDPVGRKEVRDLIHELKRAGKTVFFSTHILPDVETLCDRVGVVIEGRLRDVGRIGELLSPRVDGVEVGVVLAPGSEAILSRGRVISREDRTCTVHFQDEGVAQAAVREILDGGGSLQSFVRHRETLEDFFLRRLREAESQQDPPAAA